MAAARARVARLAYRRAPADIDRGGDALPSPRLVVITCGSDGALASDRKSIRVILPDEPPVLTPGAARVLLRILVKAHAKAMEENRQKEGRS
jgi:hypothetical protein